MIKTALIPVALIASAAIAGSAQAKEVEERVVVTVADLDLAEAADRKTLELRLNAAVRKLCNSSSRLLLDHMIESECRAEVSAGIAAKMPHAKARHGFVRIAAH
ncbi:UrcA family protein [Erythrobacter sp.]|uniref:UrcA family protein n=1 Tax=Erythrobacter sp. TaxID=1042 RepID=UPI001B226F0C|nr:UrcA family protein [Erythrobacter sp.]MBO6527749.1 UrcA family protein [Erythrobacter sp.]MBO6529964.1 UrcA family protein [Erythrobacter sp.]